jgi:EmrB/QacA subfamily drug resistance transporter
MTSMPWRQLLTEPRRPRRIREYPRAPWLAVATVCVGAFMGQLDASIVTVALPNMRRELHVSVPAIEWVALSYLLVLVGTVAAAGRLADMAGRKLLYTYGFLVFTAASLGCGMSGSLGVLIGMRVLQAVGAAMLQANSIALIRTTVRPEHFHRAIGVQGAAQALGLASGPAIGGLLVAAAGWRSIFYANLPAGAVGILLAWLLLPRTRERAARARFDWPGLATLLPASAALLLALSLLARRTGPVSVVALLAGSAVLFATFASLEHRRTAPLIDMGLFTERAFAVGISGGLVAQLILFGVLFVTPLYLEDAYLLPAGAAGLTLTVLPLGLGLAAPVGARAAQRFGTRSATVTGMAMVAVALPAALVVPMDRGVLIAALALTGMGLGLFISANNSTVAGSGRREDAGMVSGVMNMTRGIGTALGVAVAGACYALASPAIGRISRGQATMGFRAALVLLELLTLVAALLAIAAGPRKVSNLSI